MGTKIRLKNKNKFFNETSPIEKNNK